MHECGQPNVHARAAAWYANISHPGRVVGAGKLAQVQSAVLEECQQAVAQGDGAEERERARVHTYMVI